MFAGEAEGPTVDRGGDRVVEEVGAAVARRRVPGQLHDPGLGGRPRPPGCAARSEASPLRPARPRSPGLPPPPARTPGPRPPCGARNAKASPPDPLPPRTPPRCRRSRMEAYRPTGRAARVSVRGWWRSRRGGPALRRPPARARRAPAGRRRSPGPEYSASIAASLNGGVAGGQLVERARDPQDLAPDRRGVRRQQVAGRAQVVGLAQDLGALVGDLARLDRPARGPRGRRGRGGRGGAAARRPAGTRGPRPRGGARARAGPRGRRRAPRARRGRGRRARAPPRARRWSARRCAGSTASRSNEYQAASSGIEKRSGPHRPMPSCPPMPV